MVTYRNGEVPESLLITFASGVDEDGPARTYALRGPGYWDDTEGMTPEAEVDLANAWAKIYGNARNITYAEWNTLKAIGQGRPAAVK